MGAELVFFPELSLTGYDPGQAESLAIDQNDPGLDIFQRVADTTNVLVGIGFPLAGTVGVQIAMAWFTPGEPRRIYAKQFLHADETRYFVPGQASLMLEWGGLKLAPAICYESLLDAHVEAAAAAGADLYLASVAKSEAGLRKADLHYPKIASRHGLPVVMANSTGPCGDFMAAGGSAAWNARGRCLARLGGESGGILVSEYERICPRDD